MDSQDTNSTRADISELDDLHRRQERVKLSLARMRAAHAAAGPMPDEVASRLDAALAAESARRASLSL